MPYVPSVDFTQTIVLQASILRCHPWNKGLYLCHEDHSKLGETIDDNHGRELLRAIQQEPIYNFNELVSQH